MKHYCANQRMMETLQEQAPQEQTTFAFRGKGTRREIMAVNEMMMPRFVRWYLSAPIGLVLRVFLDRDITPWQDSPAFRFPEIFFWMGLPFILWCWIKLVSWFTYWRSKAAAAGECWGTISDIGIELHFQHGAMTLHWANMKKVKRWRGMVLVYFAKRACFLLPVRFFRDEQEWEAMAAFVARHVKP